MKGATGGWEDADRQDRTTRGRSDSGANDAGADMVHGGQKLALGAGDRVSRGDVGGENRVGRDLVATGERVGRAPREVGADWEDDASLLGTPGDQGVAIRAREVSAAGERLDPPPLVRTGDAGGQLPAGLSGWSATRKGPGVSLRRLRETDHSREGRAPAPLARSRPLRRRCVSAPRGATFRRVRAS